MKKAEPKLFKFNVGDCPVMSVDDDPEFSHGGKIVYRSYCEFTNENHYCIAYDNGLLVTESEPYIVRTKE